MAPLPDDPRTVVARLPTWVGDAVMVTPALRALRQRFPVARLVVGGRPHLERLLSGGGVFDEFLPLGRGRDAVGALRALDAGAGVVFPHSLRSAWELYRAGIPVRVGYATEARTPLLTHSIPPHAATAGTSATDRWKARSVAFKQRFLPARFVRAVERDPSLLLLRRQQEPTMPVPMVRQYLELVAVLGAGGDGDGPRLGIPRDVRAAGEADLVALGLDGRKFLAVNPGASFGATKVYPLDLLASAVSQLAQTSGLLPVILCGPGEESLARELESRMNVEVVCTADRLLPLDRVKVALERASLLITTDTGPWHMAMALSTPAVVLMGPTDPRYTASHHRCSTVLRLDVPCGPCHLKRCPFEHHRCMRDIAPAQVVEAALNLLGASC